MATHARTDTDVSASPYVLALRQALRDGTTNTVTTFEIGALSVEVRAGQDSLWALIRRPGAGGLAVRAAYLAGPFQCEPLKAGDGELARLRLSSVLGEHVVSFHTHDDALESLRITVTLTPAA